MVDLSIVFCMFTRSGNPYLAWLWLVISPTNLGPKARRCNHRGSMSSTRCKTLLRGRRSLPKVERGIGEKTWKYGVLSNIHLCIYTIYYIRVCIICTCIYIYIHIYIYVCVYLYIYIHLQVYLCAYICYHLLKTPGKHPDENPCGLLMKIFTHPHALDASVHQGWSKWWLDPEMDGWWIRSLDVYYMYWCVYILSTCLCGCVYMYIYTCTPVHLSVCLFMCLCIYISLHLCIYASMHLSIYLSIYLSSFPFVYHTYIYIYQVLVRSVGPKNVQNNAILASPHGLDSGPWPSARAADQIIDGQSIFYKDYDWYINIFFCSPL